MEKLTSNVEFALSRNKQKMLDSVENASEKFSVQFKTGIDKDVSNLKYLGELGYNLRHMCNQVQTQKENDFEQL